MFNIAFKGLEFGNEKVKSWLISLIISFLTDVIITLPLQVKTGLKYNKVINIIYAPFFFIKKGSYFHSSKNNYFSQIRFGSRYWFEK